MVEEYLRKFELNNKVLENFDDLMSKHLDQIEELTITEIDAKSKLLNVVGLCINIKTLIIEGDSRTNVNAIIANVCKPELLKNLILNGVKIPSNYSFKKLTNLRMVSLNNIRFCSVMSCLNEIVNPDLIEALNFEQVDFAKNSISVLNKFTNLKYLNLIKVQNCKLSDLNFLADLKNLEKINIEKNLLKFDEIGNIVNASFNKNILVELPSESENNIINTLEIGENGHVVVTINNKELGNLINSVGLEKINDLIIIVAEKENLIENIKELKKVKNKISIAVKDVSYINQEVAQTLKEELNLKYINVIDFDEALLYEKNRYCYDINTYIKIRVAIDEIIEHINVDEDELTKFLELYKILGESIMYDSMLEDEIRDYSFINESKSSNLENGLLEKKCIDSGYSEILKNCLAVLGINSKIVRGNFAGIGEEHIWNQVQIMNLWYNVDLSLDSKKMCNSKNGRFKPTFCLINDKTFSKTHIPKIAKTEYCPETFNQKIISNYFKKDSNIKVYMKSLVEKIKRIFSYNKQKLLSSGTEEVENISLEDGIKEKNEE